MLARISHLKSPVGWTTQNGSPCDSLLWLGAQLELLLDHLQWLFHVASHTIAAGFQEEACQELAAQETHVEVSLRRNMASLSPYSFGRSESHQVSS